MIPRQFLFPSLYAGTENTYIIWKGINGIKSGKKTTPGDVCQNMIEEVSDLSRQMLSGAFGNMVLSHRDEEGQPFDALHLDFKKEDGLSHLEILNISTDTLDPFAALECLKNGHAKDAFMFKIMENDPICPERVFEVECRFMDSEKNILVIEYDSNTSDIHMRYAKPILNSTRPTLKSEEAWFYLQKHMLRIAKPMKDYLSLFPEGVLPQKPNEEASEPEPNQVEPEKFWREKDADVYRPIANNPSWLQSVWQASHTPVVHSDQQIQKLREEQAKKSTRAVPIQLGACALVLACVYVLCPIVTRGLRWRSKRWKPTKI